MGYQAALEKAWKCLEESGLPGTEKVRFFTDDFLVDPVSRSVTGPAGLPARDFISVLILHYSAGKASGLPPLTGQWVSFRELESGELYYPAFRKRSIEPLLAKHGARPDGIYDCLSRMPSAGKAGQGDAGVIAEAFPGVPVQALIWKGDEEFPPEANLLFDKSISRLFCTEDVAVLAGFIPKYI